MYINSPGGSVTAGLAILDTMKMVKCPVATYCVGQAASMGAVLLATGEKGRRFALPHARIMVHQPWGGAQGKASDIEITAREILRLKEMLNGILAEAAGKTIEAVVSPWFVVDAGGALKKSSCIGCRAGRGCSFRSGREEASRA